MEKTIGIRREDKNKWERRVPLVPAHVRQLVEEGVRVVVQPSPVRVFTDDDYRQAGAEIQESLSPCSVVFAVKEIPIELLEPKKTYVFFSHVIKGQEHNMPMLQRILDLGCSLIDYEKVTDEKGKRLIFFGTHAGYAGMIDTLHALGQRLAAEGFKTPFAKIRMAHTYPTLTAAEDHIWSVGEEIAGNGLPPELTPMIFGITGYGHASTGAQDILDHLPFRIMSPQDLLTCDMDARSNKKIYKVVFREEDMVEPKAPGAAFDLQDYYANPGSYTGIFHRYLPRLSVLVNCAYWDKRYPRVMSRTAARALYGTAKKPRLRVIGDISCDLDGGIEFTSKVTEPDHPTFVYLPQEDKIVDGFAGDGPVIMAIDNLPCELPREASEFFSRVLLPYVESIRLANLSASLEVDGLPEEIRKAVIAYHGELTPAYRYLNEFLPGKEMSR
jgi:saccharopine dehydrogenase (NAD+, L-lysine forming)